MSERNSNDVVRLVTAPTPIMAHIWEQALQAEGIPCQVVGDYLDAAVGDIPGLSAEIWVHRDDLAAAEEILQRRQTASEEDVEDKTNP